MSSHFCQPHSRQLGDPADSAPRAVRRVYPAIRNGRERLGPLPGRRVLLPLLACVAAIAAVGCEDPVYDTSTPEATVASIRSMLEDERVDLIPTLIDVEARDVAFEDGVTEASAIADVKGKLGDMLARLWSVSKEINRRYADEIGAEIDAAARETSGSDFGRRFGAILADPFGVIEEQEGRLVVEDLYDGTAAVLWDDEPAFGGLVAMVETDEGWRFTVPIELARASEWWPETRHEWAVIASLMLAFENALIDFEEQLRDGEFRDLSQASERAGRLLGESAVVQGVIYAAMKGQEPLGGPPE